MEIDVGSIVVRADEPDEHVLGPAVVLAVDGLDIPAHRASAWIKYRAASDPQYWIYRSVDICDLELA